MNQTVKECKQCQQRLVMDWFEEEGDICKFCEPITITMVK
jgi:hypothetical protein